MNADYLLNDLFDWQQSEEDLEKAKLKGKSSGTKNEMPGREEKVEEEHSKRKLIYYGDRQQ